MGNVLIRADGSSKLGMGHITRCLALAYAFQERGLQVTFVCRQFDSRVEKRILDAGYQVWSIPPDLSLDQDVCQTDGLAKKHNASALVIDLCNTEVTAAPDSYESYLHRLASEWRTVIIDDLTHSVFPRAVVVNPNSGVSPGEYDVTHQPVLLTGPSYSMLHPAFRNGNARETPGRDSVRIIAVALGGGSTASLILKAIIRGIYIGFGASVGVWVATGLDNEAALLASGELSLFTGDCRVFTDLPNLASFFKSADVAVVSGGVTKYEASAAGTPAIMVAQVEHQIAWAKAFEATGAAIYAGFAPEVTAAGVARLCSNLSRSPALLDRMASTGAQLVDGWGGKRIVDACLAFTSCPEKRSPHT